MAHVFHFAEAVFQERGRGIRSRALAQPGNSEQLLTGFTEVPPGEEIPLHYHNCEEFILVVSGRARVVIEDDEHQVGPMDATLVPAGIRHQFINAGDDVLRILWVYGDQNTTRTIVATGVTLGHLDPYTPSA